jgi:V8-like Glu-specific endopeptidase
MPLLPAGEAEQGAEAEGAAGAESGSTESGRGESATDDEDALAGGAPVGNPFGYPYRTCGKIYFTQGAGHYAGSASLVAPNVLLTAGHCLFSGGNWSTRMVFYPSYPSRGDGDPVRAVACGRLSCRTSWFNSQDRAHDYGLVWMPSGPGNTVGWLGLAWNLPTGGRTWEAVGYPATPNPPFNGEAMDSAVGSAVAGAAAGTLGLSNDNMEHGSSGGPWITAFNEAVPAHANGLQSFHVTDGDFVEYGPVFTQEIFDLFTWISDPANH